MRESLVTCDTSVLVPAIRPEYPYHAQCREQLARVNVLVAHTLLEAFRVITSVSSGAAVAPSTVAATLEALALPHVQLPAEEYLPLVKRFAAADRFGGAIYDAQIAATAKHHGIKLLSRDARAARSYDVIGVDYELIDARPLV